MIKRYFSTALRTQTHSKASSLASSSTESLLMKASAPALQAQIQSQPSNPRPANQAVAIAFEKSEEINFLSGGDDIPVIRPSCHLRAMSVWPASSGPQVNLITDTETQTVQITAKPAALNTPSDEDFTSDLWPAYYEAEDFPWCTSQQVCGRWRSSTDCSERNVILK